MVLVLLAATAVLLTGAFSAPAPTPDAGTVSGEVVDHTSFACPDEPAGRRVRTSVALGLAPLPSDVRPPSGGEVRQGPVDSTGRPVDVRRGALTEVSADGGPRGGRHRRARGGTVRVALATSGPAASA